MNVKTTGNILKGVIDKNIDVEFDALAGVNAKWSEAEKNFMLTSDQSGLEFRDLT